MHEKILMAEKGIGLARISGYSYLEINLQLKSTPDEAQLDFPSGPARPLRATATSGRGYVGPDYDADKTDYGNKASVRVNSVTANVRARPT